MAAFGYLLLRQTAIREFYVSFMLPGHTHCDVDARFGNFSSYLNAKECGSPQELISAFLECIPGQAHMKQSIYNFKEVLTPYCKVYGIKSMYDFHIYLDGNSEPTVENARFELSETLLCGKRQKEDSFVSSIFRKPPPLDLQFNLVLPEMEGIEKMVSHIPKWESVITDTAKNDLLKLKEEIEKHVGLPFTTLLHTIQDKAVVLENLYENEVLISSEPVMVEESASTVDEIETDSPADVPIAIAENNTRRSSRLNSIPVPINSQESRKRKTQEPSKSTKRQRKPNNSE
uniref:DUF7869 domain-containing protein n=1 Tax=Panagrolaimus superbus TaxID=310955 RepID=A0A914YXH0_9BILA